MSPNAGRLRRYGWRLLLPAAVAVAACGNGEEDDGLPTPIVLVDDLGAVADLAVDSQAAYLFSEMKDTRVVRHPFGTTSAQILAPGAVRSNLLLEAGYLYWSEGDFDLGEVARIQRMPAAGGLAVTLTTSLTSATSAYGGMYAFAVDAEYAFIVQTDGLSIARVPLSGGAAELLVQGSALRSMAADDEYLYGHDRDLYSIVRAPKTGGALELLYPAVLAFGLVVTDADVYWVELDGMKRAPKDGTGQPEVVATTPYIANLTADGPELFWTSTDYEADETTVFRSALDGSGRDRIAVEDQWVYGLAVDTDRIYWGGLGGQLRALPR